MTQFTRQSPSDRPEVSNVVEAEEPKTVLAISDAPVEIEDGPNAKANNPKDGAIPDSRRVIEERTLANCKIIRFQGNP